MDDANFAPNVNEMSESGFASLVNTAMSLWSEHVAAGWFVLIASIVFTLAVIVFSVRRIVHRFGDPTSPRPERLFRDLVRLHGLSGEEARLLKRLAVERAAQCSAELFVRPDWFTPAGKGDEARVLALKTKLFG